MFTLSVSMDTFQSVLNFDASVDADTNASCRVNELKSIYLLSSINATVSADA